MSPEQDQFATDVHDLAHFGYPQRLLRALGSVHAFAVSFALMSVTTGIVLTFGLGLQNAGPAFVMWWPIVSLGTLFIALTFANLAGKLPITGYSYQWTSRLAGKDFGFFVGWVALVGWLGSTGGIAFGLTGWLLSLANISATGYTQAIATAVLIASFVLLNVAGIRVISAISLFSSSVEVVASLVLGLVLIVVWAAHNLNPPSIVVTANSGLTVSAFAIAALTSLWTLQTFEAASEFAEETVEARKVIPITILRTWAVGIVVGAVLLFGLVLALPNITSTLGASVPTLYVVQQALGDAISPFFWIVLIIAVYACGLASLTAAARLTFSMARDNCLPFSKVLAYVHPSLKTPTWASVAIGVLCAAMCFSADALNILGGVAALGWYLVYISTILAAMYALGNRALAKYRIAGTFDLGTWTLPVAVIALIWCVIAIGILTVPGPNNINAVYSVGGLVVGILYYVFWLRRRIAAGEAGAGVATAAAPAMAEVAAQP